MCFCGLLRLFGGGGHMAQAAFWISMLCPVCPWHTYTAISVFPMHFSLVLMNLKPTIFTVRSEICHLNLVLGEKTIVQYSWHSGLLMEDRFLVISQCSGWSIIVQASFSSCYPLSDTSLCSLSLVTACHCRKCNSSGRFSMKDAWKGTAATLL